jgi:hypothetical protein
MKSLDNITGIAAVRCAAAKQNVVVFKTGKTTYGYQLASLTKHKYLRLLEYSKKQINITENGKSIQKISLTNASAENFKSKKGSYKTTEKESENTGIQEL